MVSKATISDLAIHAFLGFPGIPSHRICFVVRYSANKAKYEDEIKTWKTTADKLNQSNSSFSDAFDGESITANRVNNKYEGLRSVLDREKVDNKRLKALVSDMQEKYMDVAESRLEFQKTMARVLNMIQEAAESYEYSKGSDLVADTLAIALECESDSKAMMAALEVETSPTPDLEASDVSYSSAMTLSDSFSSAR